MNSYILCGMQYGDEAKGSFVDWLTYYIDAKCIVKYNGGSQASHTVVTPEGITHKFSQLGSGMFKKDCHTYITKDMIVNPDNLMREVHALLEKTGESIDDLLKRVHIHKECLIVTPYHKLINQLRELSLGENRRGSVGTGVSEVLTLKEIKRKKLNTELSLTMRELFLATSIEPLTKLEALRDYTIQFYCEHEDIIKANCPDNIGFKNELWKLIVRLIYCNSHNKIYDMYNESRMLVDTLYTYYEGTIREHDKVIWEGSQGLLIDKDYGIAPNTTKLVTTNEPALNIAYLKDTIHKIGVAKAFCSRHGDGIFPTEDKELKAYINDPNQDISYWNGSPRYGWFDTVLFRYANKINKVNQVFMSSFDKLAGLPKVKICTSYQYHGNIDDDFDDIFEYNIKCNGDIIINNINHNNIKLKQYLLNCTPVYKEYKGWESLDNKDDFISKCSDYIKAIEENIKVQVTVASIGPTRNDKIVLGNIHKKSRSYE